VPRKGRGEVREADLFLWAAVAFATCIAIGSPCRAAPISVGASGAIDSSSAELSSLSADAQALPIWLALDLSSPETERSSVIPVYSPSDVLATSLASSGDFGPVMKVRFDPGCCDLADAPNLQETLKLPSL